VAEPALEPQVAAPTRYLAQLTPEDICQMQEIMQTPVDMFRARLMLRLLEGLVAERMHQPAPWDKEG
jgi:hypothetical protein